MFGEGEGHDHSSSTDSEGCVAWASVFEEFSGIDTKRLGELAAGRGVRRRFVLLYQHYGARTHAGFFGKLDLCPRLTESQSL